MVQYSITQQAQTLAQKPPSQHDSERLHRMKDAWDAYRGKFPNPLTVIANQPDDNVISNRCRPIVDKGVSFLFGSILKINAPDGNSDLNDFLSHLWGDDDDRMTLLSQAAINGAVCGEVFLRLVPPQGNMQYPRIVVLDPLNIRLVTAPDDCSLVLAYIIEYPGVNQMRNKQIISRVDPDNMVEVAGYEELDDTWTITNYQQRGSLNMQQQVWQQVSQEEWPYPFPPIFCCQNLPSPNEPWGEPDLTQDLIAENKALNFVQSNLARIIKYHGHPITYAIGVQAQQIQVTVDNMLCLPDPNSKIEKIAAMDNFSGLLNFMSAIRDNMDEQSRVPAVALGRIEALPRGMISGVALELLFQPLIEKTIQKRRLYGCMIREISRAALCYCDYISIDDYEDYDIELHWMNLLPVDNKEAADTALELLQVGVSQQTVLSQLGYDPEAEAQKIDAKPMKTQIPPKPAATNSSNQSIATNADNSQNQEEQH